MNITFFIGNGFDINLGLKTKYIDFYPEYIKEFPLDTLAKEIKDEESDWSNLEWSLGQFLKEKFQDREEVFIQSKNRMDNALSRYLIKESQRKLIFDTDAAVEFQNRIAHLDQFLSRSDAETYRNATGSIGNRIYYCFINFNYTNTLDQIIEYSSKQINPFSTHIGGGTSYHDVINPPIHIHGTTETELVLGVNDISQMSKHETISDELALSMIKPEINDNLGNRRNEDVQRIIDESKYIIIYGMSIGSTDLKWWKSIFSWMKPDPARRLIIFHYSNDGAVASGGQTAQRQNSTRKKFFKTIDATEEEYNKHKKQVIVQINSPIFSFEKIHIEKRNKDIEEGKI